MSELTEEQRQHLIELLQEGSEIPSSYKLLLFSPQRVEAELVFKGKEREEDILANTMAVPLQPIRTFGSIMPRTTAATASVEREDSTPPPPPPTYSSIGSQETQYVDVEVVSTHSVYDNGAALHNSSAPFSSHPLGALSASSPGSNKEAVHLWHNSQDWHNLLIFGDNLQAMQTLLKMKEAGKLVNTDGSLGVRLVYIDPPFGTGDEYGPSNGEMAYSARVQGARFMEFLRKRLVLIRELLAPGGTVFVRLDHHFGHYIKVLMDEVFGPANFRNEIVINRIQKRQRDLKILNVSTESLFFYSKSPDYYFKHVDAPRMCHYCGKEKEPVWEDMTSPGLRNPPERVIFGQTYLPRRGRHFMYTQARVDDLEKEGRLRVNPDAAYYDLKGERIQGRPEYRQTDEVVIDNNWTDIKGYAYLTDYPTENHEMLLERVLLNASGENDIILDAFAGSGTTLAVAEKMGRRWIGIDCGKLSIYTIQKRLLNLKSGIGNKSTPLKPKPFTLYNAGLYDFAKLRMLPWEGWRFFALNLFGCRDVLHKVRGITLDGYRGLDDALVFDYRQNGGVVLDYGFIDDLHIQIGSRLGSRFFIIAPAASVAFLEDYVDKGNTRYYVLRIPYSIINELHHRDFEAITQPVTEAQVNETVEAIGFDFIRPPKVECDYLVRHLTG